MIQLSASIRAIATRSTLDTLTPNATMRRSRHHDNRRDGRQAALRQASTATTSCVTMTWLTRAQTPPPRKATRTASTWPNIDAKRL